MIVVGLRNGDDRGLSDKFYMSAYPYAHADRLNGEISALEIDSIISSLLNERYQAAQVAFLFGSTAKGTRKAWSDVDLLIIMPSGADITKPCFIYTGLPFEVYVHTPQSLVHMLNPRHEAVGSIFVSILESRIIFDPYNQGQSIRNLARESLMGRKAGKNDGKAK